MRTIKQLIAGLLTVSMMLGLSLPISSGELADSPSGKERELVRIATEIWINPLYENEYSPDDFGRLTTQSTPPLLFSSSADEPEYTDDIDVAAASLRDQMKERKAIVTVHMQLEEFDSSEMSNLLFSRAIEHTGEPTEGDYLRWQYGGYDCGMSGSYDGEYYYITFTYRMIYYTTSAQEAEMDLAVDALLDELIEDHMSDYEKVCAIYGWMCENITYDYANLGDDTYMLKHTAYAALIDRTAVCQGYAVLLYRLLLEVGIDCRLVAGIGNGGGHAWNLICLDGVYYNADSTWDASYSQAGWDYEYFLRGKYTFDDHASQMEETFDQQYPVSEEDYVPHAPHIHDYVITVIPATCTEEGYTRYDCTCGIGYSDLFTQKLPHNYGEWVVTLAPGADTVGEERRECADCHTQETREIPAIGIIRIAGDIDGDGEVTQMDIQVLRQYLCGIDVAVEEESLDVNGDGNVNMRDVARLAQYLSGLAVELQ